LASYNWIELLDKNIYYPRRVIIHLWNDKDVNFFLNRNIN
jgi:hypothetical protein